MLDDTLIIWGGVGGRTSCSQGKLDATTWRRDHNPRCPTHGSTDDFSYNIAEGGVHGHVVKDIVA